MKSNFFKNNRKRICENVEGGVIVLSAYDKMQQTNDGAAPFIQEANFWWLTGLELPGWRLLLDCTTNETALVPPTLSDIEKMFDSYYTDEMALAISGADSIISTAEYFEKLHGKDAFTLQPNQEAVSYFCYNPAPQRLWEEVQLHAKNVHDVRLSLAKLRAIKQPEEIAQMQQAIDYTINSFSTVAAMLPNLTNETEVAAQFTYEFMKRGAVHAYDPIVASGRNACTLHYCKNNAPLEGLLLLDVGARVNGYNADISRTYSIGEPTQRQRDVHAAVQRVHDRTVAAISAGASVREYIYSADDFMRDALIDLGLLKDKSDTTTFRKYFPHAMSHGLGVDVHDSLGQPEVFEQGMVLTVEPGIYIPEENIGVRIEDDILVTERGRKNLSAKLSTMV